MGRQHPHHPLTGLPVSTYTFNVVKIKNPLLSFISHGRVGDITFRRSRKTNIAEQIPVVPDQKTALQSSWRHMYQKCANLWHTLSAAEKAEWESLARSHHMTGFAYWQSQCLKPNPGIYLPLQGGTMQGNINMDKHRLLKLPLPSDIQEPVTLEYHTSNIAPYLYHESARVYHNADQVIPHATLTALSFNSERFDTDSIHSLVINNSRLTCKTAGKYFINAHLRFAANNVGIRALYILGNGVLSIAVAALSVLGNVVATLSVATLFELSVNDYVECYVYQTSGGALNVLYFAADSPEFMMARVCS